jgi:hypothetical protein
MDAAEEADPAIRARPVPAPLFITGMPRSGSTFLHMLLARDAGNLVPRCWQLIYPFSKGRLPAGPALRRLQVAAQLRVFQALSPGLREMHPLAADMPQECTDITAQIFQSLRFEFVHHVPAYREWLAAHGHGAAMRFHRRFLQHLEAQSGPGRWVLKSPDHVFALDAIVDAYPDARFVFLHRDPVNVVGSCARLVEALRRPFSLRVDRREIGRDVAARLLQSADHMMRATVRLGPERILHLHYQALVSDPMAAVREIYRHCGRSLERPAEMAMRQWLGRQADRRRPRHPLADYGVHSDGIYADFMHYMEQFGVALPSAVSG